ncbi:MAP3K12-binding inhibitory protein 1 isoform 2-T2 [Clarias gariepinus]|uniref:MAP3K12-binding inhibitory protein 1 isoform X2 n=1 Tax=Clarias gariepinus TaxID=13013 RepID=UPI00234E0A1D|nr:MAP3K12-binding inhibitory protein 1 isoform X2 [Clarias gariepinus]
MDYKQEASAAEMSPDVVIKHSLQECFSSLIGSMAEFSSEVKLSPGVLNVTASVSDLNFTELQPSHVYHCLQKHISKLQFVSAHLKQILNTKNTPDLTSIEKTEKCMDNLAATSEEEIVVHRELIPSTSHQHAALKDIGMSQHDDRSVQIKAGKAEIERRISAFIERKQLEINENNVREFCNVINCNQENSCARTDAVFTPYPGFKSHVKVTRVVNTYGPQTRGGRSEQGEQQQVSYSRNCGNPVIEERLHNIEAHLKLTAGPVPQSIYQRLKKLEDRILELEGLSPEYFHSMSYSHKRPKVSVAQNYSLSELDGKISAVRTALLKRASDFQSRDVREFPF